MRGRGLRHHGARGVGRLPEEGIRPNREVDRQVGREGKAERRRREGPAGSAAPHDCGGGPEAGGHHHRSGDRGSGPQEHPVEAAR